METETIDIRVEDRRDTGHPVTAAIAIGSLATMQQPALLSDLAFSNHVVGNDLGAKSQLAHQDAMNRLRQGIVAGAVARVQGPGPGTARAAVDVLTGNALAQEIADLKAAVDAFGTRP
ncbi:hypothetical protein H4F99_00920 [Lysobacter sp. SG-8]|uniref:Uncharacterized protein n=1 Tax=Marilutibacter penaei TaxID=2759900 RepID=A0A7W3U181_9GAMM|nr:hypothetical protein [Lysobacter penaei]MBB1087043.1 hypothetical protein [Lysobacter penaei]